MECKIKGHRKTLPIKKYPNKNRLYLKYIISNFRKSDTWKIELTITIIFLLRIDNDEERVIQKVLT